MEQKAMHKEICTLGPLPVSLIGEGVLQIEKQGWTVRWVSFAGMIEPAVKMLPLNTALPAFVCIAEIYVEDGKKAPQPKIDFSNLKQG